MKRIIQLGFLLKGEADEQILLDWFEKFPIECLAIKLNTLQNVKEEN